MFAIACACGAAAAQAEPFGEKSSVVLFVGGNAAMPGSFSAPRSTLNSTTPIYNSLDFSDAYDHRYTGGAEFDYAFDSHVSAFARASYAQFNGTSHEIGVFFSDTDGRVPINANFDDTHSTELNLGARYTFAAGARLRPFVGLGLGAADLSAVHANVQNLDGSGMTPVELARSGTVFEQRLETGLQYSPMRNFDVRLTAAANHLDGQKQSNDPNLALLGLDAPHGDVPGHWDYPVELGTVWHF
jgi:hypothetical protein